MTSTVATQSQAFSAHPTIHLAIELSRKRWVVAAHLPGCDKISLHDVEGGNGPALLALIDRLVHRVERQLGQPPSVVSCFEAGFDGFWLHRFLEQNQVSNFVPGSTSIQVPRRARRTKTDRVDAAAMLRVPMACCRGETKICSIVRVPSVDEEDARRTHRERLVRERIQHTTSGDSRRNQGISKAGNTRARMTLIELAWLWMRYQPQSDPATWFRARAGTGPSRMRRIAIVAVARKLLVSLWRYLHTGIVPPGAECKTMPAVG